MRVLILALSATGFLNAPDDQSEPPTQPIVAAPTVPKETVKEPDFTVSSTKPVRNLSSVTNIKGATNARSEFGTLPPIKLETGTEKFELPILELEGCEQAIVLGDIVELSIRPIEKLPVGLKSAIYSWTILPPPPRVLPWVDSTKVIFGTGIKDQEYTIILTATYAFANEDLKTIEHRTSTLIKKVVVGVSAIPKQSSTNVNLNESANIIKNSFTLIAGPNYSEDMKKKDFKLLAASFKKVADIAESKPELTVRTVMTTQSESNVEVLKENVGLYKAWYDSIGQQFTQIQPDTPVSKTDLVKVYRIIAAALESY
jgi:hypothetical protein